MEFYYKSSKENIINMLLRMKYKNNKDILIDEFQVYYNTESQTFLKDYHL